MKTWQQFNENILQKVGETIHNRAIGVKSFTNAIDQKFPPKMQKNAENTFKNQMPKQPTGGSRMPIVPKGNYKPPKTTLT